jgi:hypothetical protein
MTGCPPPREQAGQRHDRIFEPNTITWLEYRPSRRSTAPFSPVGAASYSATTSSLYWAVNVRRRARWGTSGSGRSCRSPVTRPASPATRARSSTVIVIKGLVSIPALGEVSSY